MLCVCCNNGGDEEQNRAEEGDELHFDDRISTDLCFCISRYMLSVPSIYTSSKLSHQVMSRTRIKSSRLKSAKSSHTSCDMILGMFLQDLKNDLMIPALVPAGSLVSQVLVIELEASLTEVLSLHRSLTLPGFAEKSHQLSSTPL